jgi:hypothetical protein
MHTDLKAAIEEIRDAEGLNDRLELTAAGLAAMLVADLRRKLAKRDAGRSVFERGRDAGYRKALQELLEQLEAVK